MNKKLFMIIGGVLLVIIVVGGVFAYLSGKNKSAVQNQTSDQTTTDTSNTTSNTGASAGSASPLLKKITDAASIAPAISFDGQAVWFFTAEGNLFKVNVATGLKQE